MLDMDLGSGECGGYAVVALRGELDLVNAEAVAAGLRAVAAREPRIIVDLAGLEFIDASGIAALVRGRRHARNAGGDVLLAAPQRLVRRVLAIVIWEVTASPFMPAWQRQPPAREPPGGRSRRSAGSPLGCADKHRNERTAPKQRAVTGGSWVPCSGRRRPAGITG